MIFTKSEEFFPSEIGSFRPIYYLGCKASFTSSIKSAIDEVDPSGGRLVDLFAGTGVVAGAMGASRSVTTVDVQEYSRVLCSALLRPATLTQSFINAISDELANGDNRKRLSWCMQPLIDYEQGSINAAVIGNTGPLIELLESPPLIAYEEERISFPNSLLGESVEETIGRLNREGLSNSRVTTVSRNFGGIYFSFRQTVLLDVALSIAEDAEEGIRDTLKATALSSASTLVNTVGKQFAQPIQPRNRAGNIKPGLANMIYRDRRLNALSTYKVWLAKYARLPRRLGNPETLRMDYLQALQSYGSSFSAIYADPPYTRDHYSRFYHVLETMCLRDNPTVSKVKRNGRSMISRGVYRANRHQSPFCIRSTAPGAFEALFKTSRKYNLPLVLSYSPHETGDGTHPRAISMEQLVDLANQHYKRVEVCGVKGVTHNKLSRDDLKLKTRDQAEVLLKCFV